MRRLTALLLLATSSLPLHAAQPPAQFSDPNPVFFNKTFESAAMGDIDRLGENEFRFHVIGQQDSRGRNRQATWFLFRMDNVAGRELTLHFTDFKGEYNDLPGNSPVGANYRPWFSEDNAHWQHVTAIEWDKAKDEVTIKLRPKNDTVWVAHVPPYPLTRLLRLLEEIDRSPHARVETIGRTVEGRDLHLVTVTNLAVPDAQKKVVWLQARQHPWETGTSYITEGALRFVTSDDPAAKKLRDETIFKFTPMMNPDGVARGDVRFNVLGYDTNRQWDKVDLRDKQWLQKMPEIWYVKTAIFAQQARQPINVMVNLHTNENNEYFEHVIDAEPQQALIARLFATLREKTQFDPSRPAPTISIAATSNTTNSLWREAKVPLTLLEQRITESKKLGRIATPEDKLVFGRELISAMAEVVR
jgi:hypothetical protein